MNLAKEKEDPCPDLNSLYAESKDDEDIIVLNVGGVRHEVLLKTLQKFPESGLGKLSSSTFKEQPTNSCNEYEHGRQELYFDRNPIFFNVILDFYRTGKLHFNDDICALSLCDELQFWMIGEANLSPCCKDKYSVKKLQATRGIKKETKIEETDQSSAWNLLDNPGSSIPARIYQVVSLLNVILYLCVITLSTVPALQVVDVAGDKLGNTNLALLQLVCIAFATLEFILRFIFSPNKCQFLKGWMNIVDFLAILPYFIALAVPSQLTILLWLLTMLRVIWIVKLIRYSPDLQTVFSILGSSMQELFLLIQVLAVGAFFFGSLTYFAENDEEQTGFVSFPEAFWFAIVTMTTVGYGDFTPTTAFGRILACLCAICGVLLMVLPIAVIAVKFAEFYNQKKKEREIAEHVGKA